MKRLFLFLVVLLAFATAQAQTAGEGINVTHYEIHVWDFDLFRSIFKTIMLINLIWIVL